MTPVTTPVVDLDGFERDDEVFNLTDVEAETVCRAAEEQALSFDPAKRKYTRQELSRYGIVREGYSRDELRARGVVCRVVSSLDVTRGRGCAHDWQAVWRSHTEV
jgi:hypothetical protein